MNKLLEYLGILMLLGGIAGAIYFLMFFNTAVTTEPVMVMGQSIGGGQQVNDLGLMADRQNGLLVSIGGAILGALFLFAGHSMTEKMQSPAVAVPVRDQAKLCADWGKYYAQKAHGIVIGDGKDAYGAKFKATVDAAIEETRRLMWQPVEMEKTPKWWQRGAYTKT